jgi:hypothetical protein
MSSGSRWSLKGEFDPEAKNSTFGFAYAVIVASLTFQTHAQRYRIAMCVIILLAAVFIAKKAIASTSILGIATGIFSLLWILPIFDSHLFYRVDGWYMLAHSALALAVAFGAFSYLKN